jgi:hypothetical protein
MLDVKIANTSLLYAEAAVSLKQYHTERVSLIYRVPKSEFEKEDL